MNSSQILSISPSFTIPELLSVIHLSFEPDEFEEAERILIRRYEDLLNQVKDLQREVEHLKKERDLLEKLHGLAELERLSMEKELKKREVGCEELSESVNRLAEEQKSLIDSKFRAEEMCKNAMEEVKRLENEGKMMIVELKRKNEELEEEIARYRDKCYRKILGLEEMAASLMGKDAMNVRNGVGEDRNPSGTCRIVRSSSCDSAKKHNLQLLHKEGGDMDGADLSIGRHNMLTSGELSTSCQPEIDKSSSAHKEESNEAPNEAALVADSRTHDAEACERKQSVASSTAASEGPNVPMIVIDSDDETAAEGSVCIARICGLEVNSSEDQIPLQTSMNRRCSLKTKEEDVGIESFDLLHKRKRSLDSSDENDTLAIRTKKTQDTEQVYHGYKGSLVNVCSTMTDLVALGSEGTFPSKKSHLVINSSQGKATKCASYRPSSRRLSLDDSSDCSSADSDDESIADSGISNAIAELRKKAWKSADDMLSGFQSNYELCMKAVCVLYRRIMSGEKSATDPPIPGDVGFIHFIAMRGKDLAEFLINEDPKHRLRRTVEEVKEKRPETLDRCRQLAVQYNEKLFEIFRKGEDPFFSVLS